MLRAVYAGATRLAAPGLRLMLRRRAAAGREIAGRLAEREGIEAAARPAGRLVWMHAASVGESLSVLPVLAALPDDIKVLMTTGTVTSAAMLARRLPEMGLHGRVMHRFVPLDVPRWTARFLDHWKPDAAVFVESEVWPNLLAGCASRKIPALLVNARLSPGSFARWRRVMLLARALFGGFSWVQAQSAGDAARIAKLGGPIGGLTGNLKFAAEDLPVNAVELARLRTLIGDRPCWVAASIHPGEDRRMLAVHRRLSQEFKTFLTILVPRHPERGAQLQLLVGGEFPVTRRSAGEGPPLGGIWVMDTLGELGLAYRLGTPVFVGRSLGASGGQNPLEPARLGCAVAVGPEVANFDDIVVILEAAGAVARVTDEAGLAAWVLKMLADPLARKAMGEAGMRAARDYAELPGAVAAAIVARMRG